MKTVYPFYYQYEVRPTDDADKVKICGALATVMVFAESDESGRARAGRYIARRGWRIVAVKRAILIEPRHLAAMEGVLKNVYRKAEQSGISACFDSWDDAGKQKTTW